MERKSTADGPRLLDQAREFIRIRHYSICTEQAYVQWIRRFILFHDKRYPRDMAIKVSVSYRLRLAGRLPASVTPIQRTYFR
jgi:hypothetical protein